MPAAQSSSSGDSLVSHAQSFVSENKKAVAVGVTVAVIAAGATGYYLYTTKPRTRGDSSAEKGKSDTDSGKGGVGGEKKKRKHKSKVGEKDGPILEERTPKPPAPEENKVTEAKEEDVPKFTQAEIEALSKEDRLSTANSLKTKGNTAYSARNFVRAVEYYTQAIEISPSPEAVYFSNRAACYVNFSPPQYELVVQDCDEALKRDAKYIKALNRRATALEALGRLHESLRDFTAATIFDKFQNDATSASLERVLKKVAQREAQETMAKREPRLPSFAFIHAYLAAFRPRPLPELPAARTQGDQTLVHAHQALEAQDYAHAFTLANESIEQGISESWDVGKAQAFTLRGTFKFLIGKSQDAKADFEAALALVPTFIPAWVKIASVHMELGDTDATFRAFEEAIKHAPNDADTYYHRGQVNFIMQQFKEAEGDYIKSSQLDPNFVFSHIQLAVAQYKTDQVGAAMATFRKTMKMFPHKSEPLNYYGELLLDQQRFTDAVEKFDRAIEIERKKKPINVLPMVNKALALFQWNNDILAAEALLKEALKIDPECDSALATLAQLTLQQSNLEEAIVLFGRHAELARTEAELEQALTFKYATQAQLQFIKDFPDMASQLSMLARSMQGVA
ncbi:mitochondrial outer membrane translocase receptor TOM70 [Cantharellus anzutake]|uniref:mitochondrial outer membrane translocase receptor TOM70 n=1 Tax=Cantharellus anzutake TaxID=1750568 RepID=UPI0019081F0B|nr:mitochondrial outer membrane translocase receptor TOM70 [Cantharellus anzutake]XP_038910059.1 mitochondrial outer membrane translocase receptor TOM70 [Cantharellus anzutake]KAF8315550.1 mitochondrial outer membrane translocase receptor TOM70 [Cantharellus anzutake]KAF8319489.1 mitochondrial outer membrane translocase receptor TOM70 [Cantharellus anzutake]